MTLILVSASLLFLPPLALIVQTTGDHNFCGTWCLRMFFAWRKGTSLAGYFAGWGRASMGVALVLAALAATLLLGRYWCSHLCPVGGALELGSRLVPKPLKLNLTAIPAAPFRSGVHTALFQQIPGMHDLRDSAMSC